MARVKVWAISMVAMLSACGQPDQPNNEGEPTATVAAAPDGEKLYLQCRACHTVGAGEAHGIGPNLNGIVDSKAASKADYVYSPALKAANIVWTHDKLDAFIAGPAKLVPGTKMAFAGVNDAKQRAALIDYLSTLTPDKK